MHTNIDKTQSGRSQSVTNTFSQKKNGTPSTFHFEDNRPKSIVQKKQQEAINNSTGIPDRLKSGIESLSGQSMDDVKVHYNSNKPAQLQAHAYAQGTDIHLASGQEKHLPHEAWHVVQQKQGRVRPTIQMKSDKQSKFLSYSKDVLQGKFSVEGQEVSNMKEVADDANTWQKYESLSPTQRSIFRDLLAEDHIFSFELLTRFIKDRIEFYGSSGDRTRGIYNKSALAQLGMSLQANDAEVSILQQAHNFLQRNIPPEMLKTLKITLYIKVSKGPCTSCQRLFKLFMQHFPGSKVIIQYTQKTAMEKEKVGKSRGQSALKYGYVDALSMGQSHLKVLHPLGIPSVAGIKGYKGSTLNGLLERYLERYHLNPDFINQYVKSLSKGIYLEKDHEQIIHWMHESITSILRKQPSAPDAERINELPAQVRGAKVTAAATLFIE